MATIKPSAQGDSKTQNNRQKLPHRCHYLADQEKMPNVTCEHITKANKILFIGSLLPQRSNFSNVGEAVYIVSLEECVPVKPPYYSSTTL